MSATCTAPEPETIVEGKPVLEEKPVRQDEAEPSGWKQRVRELLVAIFEGHEEFLGMTPD